MRDKIVVVTSSVAIALGIILSTTLGGCAKQESTPAVIDAPTQIEAPADNADQTTPDSQEVENEKNSNEEDEVAVDEKTLPADAEEVKTTLGNNNSILEDTDEPLSAEETESRTNQIASYLQSAFDELKVINPPMDNNETYQAAIGKWFPNVTVASRAFQQLICNNAPVTIDYGSIQVLKNPSLDEGVYKVAFTMARDGETVAWFDGYWVDGANYMKLSDFRLIDGYAFTNINGEG